MILATWGSLRFLIAGRPSQDQWKMNEAAMVNLDGFDGVLYLDQPALWTEGIDTSIILTPREEHSDEAL